MRCSHSVSSVCFPDDPDLSLHPPVPLEGWLAKIKLSNPGEFDQLLSAEAYKAFCEGA